MGIERGVTDNYCVSLFWGVQMCRKEHLFLLYNRYADCYSKQRSMAEIVFVFLHVFTESFVLSSILSFIYFASLTILSTYRWRGLSLGPFFFEILTSTFRLHSVSSPNTTSFSFVVFDHILELNICSRPNTHDFPHSLLFIYLYANYSYHW